MLLEFLCEEMLNFENSFIRGSRKSFPPIIIFFLFVFLSKKSSASSLTFSSLFWFNFNSSPTCSIKISEPSQVQEIKIGVTLPLWKTVRLEIRWWLRNFCYNLTLAILVNCWNPWLSERSNSPLASSLKVSLLFLRCPVPNAIKLLQACIYKSVKTGLFLTSLVATCIVKFTMLMLDSESIRYWTLKTSIKMGNLAILVATSNVKNSPVFTDSTSRCFSSTLAGRH